MHLIRHCPDRICLIMLKVIGFFLFLNSRRSLLFLNVTLGGMALEVSQMHSVTWTSITWKESLLSVSMVTSSFATGQTWESSGGNKFPSLLLTPKWRAQESWLEPHPNHRRGLKDVAKMKQLTDLFLSDTKITKAGVAELQKALPKCKIYSNPTK